MRLTLSLVLLVASAGAAILYWPQVYIYLIDPAARIFWLFYRVLLMFDQEVYWFLFIFLSFILAALMIPGRPEKFTSAYKTEAGWPDGQYSSWKILFESIDKTPGARLALQDRLEELQKNISAMVDRDEPGKINLPTGELFRRPGSQIDSFKSRFSHILYRRNKQPDPQLLKSIDQMIASMEASLEIHNDRSNEPPDSE